MLVSWDGLTPAVEYWCTVMWWHLLVWQLKFFTTFKSLHSREGNLPLHRLIKCEKKKLCTSLLDLLCLKFWIINHSCVLFLSKTHFPHCVCIYLNHTCHFGLKLEQDLMKTTQDESSKLPWDEWLDLINVSKLLCKSCVVKIQDVCVST